MNHKAIIVQAFAKINLSLNITGVRGHLHTLDMVLASVDLADAISVCARVDHQVNICYSDSDITVGNDSVTKAVNALRSLSGRAFGADITVTKHIPIAAGLGGSGVDAAGAIAALDCLYGFGQEVCRAAAKIAGSDTLYLSRGGFARVQGTGDKVVFFDSSIVFHLVIANGGGGVLSASAYSAFDRIFPEKRYCPTDTDALIAALRNGDREGVFPHMKNALCASALTLNPSIANTLTALANAGAAMSLMTGSGSACVGFFSDSKTAEQAADRLKAQGFWAQAAKSKAKGIEILDEFNSY